MSQYLAGVLTGIGVSVMANLLYDVIVTPIGNRIIRHRIYFTPEGNNYHVVFTDICGTVSVPNSKWGWFVKRGSIPLSVRLIFKSGDGKEIKTFARWKVDMDESTVTYVKLGSIRECILMTLQGDLIHPGSEITVNHLQGNWDMHVEIIDGDTSRIYTSIQFKDTLIEGKLNTNVRGNSVKT